MVAALERIRPQSASMHRGDLSDTDTCAAIVAQAQEAHGGLHLLVNNAAAFYPTPLADATAAQWNDLMDLNLKAPYFLAQAAAPTLAKHRGLIVNITDIYGKRPLNGYSIYSVAKAGLIMQTRALAVELAPAVRVNAVSPGPILWPEADCDESRRRAVIARIPLQTEGKPENIAEAVRFLALHAEYMTGQVLIVDGGRSARF